MSRNSSDDASLRKEVGNAERELNETSRCLSFANSPMEAGRVRRAFRLNCRYSKFWKDEISSVSDSNPFWERSNLVRRSLLEEEKRAEGIWWMSRRVSMTQ